MNIGVVIRNIRKERKISQKELSEITGLSKTIISLFEKNRKFPSVDSVKKIGEALNTSTVMLYALSVEEKDFSANENMLFRYRKLYPIALNLMSDIFTD